MTHKFSMIIPCYNEAANLPALIDQLKILESQGCFEFILVNNGSTDNTSEIFSSFEDLNFKVVNLMQNAGYGGGIKAGINLSQGEYIGWIHADLQYSLIECLQNLGGIEGSVKFIKGRRRGRTSSQSALSAGMSLFESMLFTTALYDINAQPTIFHKEVLSQMKNIPDDFSIDLYAYVFARRLKLKTFRFEVDFIKRSHGKSSWNTGIKSVIRMIFRTVRYSFHLRKNEC